MKIVKWILIVVAALALVLVAWLAYLGIFSTPQVTEQKIGPYTLVYEEYTGPYSGIGPTLQKVYDSLKADGIVTTKGFGIYLDDPKTTPPAKLRSYVGCVLNDKDLGKVRQLRRKHKVRRWPLRNCLVAEFPIRSDLSYMIGPLKAYPELGKALAAKKYRAGECLELYDMPARKIMFLFEIKK